jgi:hypothetical protein
MGYETNASESKARMKRLASSGRICSRPHSHRETFSSVTFSKRATSSWVFPARSRAFLTAILSNFISATFRCER